MRMQPPIIILPGINLTQGLTITKHNIITNMGINYVLCEILILHQLKLNTQESFSAVKNKITATHSHTLFASMENTDSTICRAG